MHKLTQQFMRMMIPQGIVYATWNPADKHANVTLSNGNLTAQAGDSVASYAVRATQGKASGKWYWEIVWVSSSAAQRQVTLGVGNSTMSLATYVGGDINGWSYENDAGNKINNVTQTAYGAVWAVGDRIGIALNMTTGKIWFSKNGVWQASGDPAADTGAAFIGLTGTLFPAFANAWIASEVVTANFGATPFTYPVPAGFNSGVY